MHQSFSKVSACCMHSSAAMMPHSTPEKLLVCIRATALVSPIMFDVHLKETNIAYYTPSLSLSCTCRGSLICRLLRIYSCFSWRKTTTWLIRRLCPYHGEFEKVINPYTRKFAIQGECGKCVFLVISLIGRAWTQLNYCSKERIENWVPEHFW